MTGLHVEQTTGICCSRAMICTGTNLVNIVLTDLQPPPPPVGRCSLPPRAPTGSGCYR
ncbi:hypothetical protein C8R44DRAFT_799133 [Mycena epipterygia]|nr:hypothetical protein C8R44DRAFT_799133 [Mycena epipterygia]